MPPPPHDACGDIGATLLGSLNGKVRSFPEERCRKLQAHRRYLAEAAASEAAAERAHYEAKVRAVPVHTDTNCTGLARIVGQAPDRGGGFSVKPLSQVARLGPTGL